MKRSELLTVATQIYAARIAAFEGNKSGYLDFVELAEDTVEVARVLISEVDLIAEEDELGRVIGNSLK